MESLQESGQKMLPEHIFSTLNCSFASHRWMQTPGAELDLLFVSVNVRRSKTTSAAKIDSADRCRFLYLVSELRSTNYDTPCHEIEASEFPPPERRVPRITADGLTTMRGPSQDCYWEDDTALRAA